ncbi:hypothetical protein GGX14DRAFT_557472 [Mycena pura]|uniref:NADP-dependent oxidoreductase domain-containing protein n=1 Tax=Mycena pura TaxID=153505 RepID=A0AAD6YNP0_9AGAR|nr:hypothetical protein GGX14DRAFT_557472 [Mycena pura]
MTVQLAKGCSPSTLSHPFAKNPNTSTIILGASSATQLRENLDALRVLPLLTDAHMAQIENILANKPAPLVRLLTCPVPASSRLVLTDIPQPMYSRPPLDAFGRL